MYAIKAVYDGRSFTPTEPVPVSGEYEVVITFTAPVKSPDRPKQYCRKEKAVITNSLFGVLPPDIDLEKAREERLR